MYRQIETICVVGGGSAGYLSAVTLRRLLPGRRVVAVHSPDKPVIGVGESTTAYLPVFLHRQLALDRRRFYAEVQPIWKLGIRFIWGPPEVDHFNYPLGFELSERVDPLRKRAAYYCDGPILPYTTAETMDHGWCWRIDLTDRVTLGYVHSSQFCSPDEAMRELREKKPELGDDLRVIRFPSGRYENYWMSNVVAIGNASGFVEPLESTALHVIAEQLVSSCAALLDSDYRIEPPAHKMANRRFRQTWDSIRDFLAVHYKFNHRLDTPFWQHCRKKIRLGDAQPVVDMYQQIGPHQACKTLIPPETVVQFEGYLALLMGQHVATDCASQWDEQDLRDWNVIQEHVRRQVSQAMPVREGLRVVSSPAWNWSG